MKILIPALSAASRPDGVTRHAINLARCLMLRPEIERVDMVVGEWQRSFFTALLGKTSARLQIHTPRINSTVLARNRWFDRQLPALASSLRSDLIHVAYPVPLDRHRLPSPVVVTLHDLYPYDIPENFGFPRVFVTRIVLEHCLTAVDAIASVSRSTHARLMVHRPELASKAVVVSNMVEAQEPGCAAPLHALEQRSFVLCVSQHRRNKNIPLALATFRSLLQRHPQLLFVLVGNKGPETASLDKLLASLALHGRVVLLHGITDPELQWCYRHCELLLATSTHEGFGLPVAEAMLAGCPVVCTDIAPFREVAAGYASYAAPGVSTLKAAIEGTLARSRPCPAQLPHLSAPVIAGQYVKLYQHLLTPSPACVPSLQWMSQKGGMA